MCVLVRVPTDPTLAVELPRGGKVLVVTAGVSRVLPVLHSGGVSDDFFRLPAGAVFCAALPVLFLDLRRDVCDGGGILNTSLSIESNKLVRSDRKALRSTQLWI